MAIYRYILIFFNLLVNISLPNLNYKHIFISSTYHYFNELLINLNEVIFKYFF